MQGPSMRPCKFENEAIFSKDLRPKCRLRCTSGAYGMPREKHDAGADLHSRTHSRSLRHVAPMMRTYAEQWRAKAMAIQAGFARSVEPKL
jgi:hypothetical protein